MNRTPRKPSPPAHLVIDDDDQDARMAISSLRRGVAHQRAADRRARRIRRQIQHIERRWKCFAPLILRMKGLK